MRLVPGSPEQRRSVPQRPTASDQSSRLRPNETASASRAQSELSERGSASANPQMLSMKYRHDILTFREEGARVLSIADGPSNESRSRASDEGQPLVRVTESQFLTSVGA